MAVIPSKESLEGIVNEPIKGADIIIQALAREGVKHIFGYPGGASMEIHQAITRANIKHILPRHEQGAAFMANGYARASGKLGVCLATSGPGAINLFNGIVDAFYDSVPMLALTGQVPTSKIGTDAFQETPVFSMTEPVVKHSYLVEKIERVPRAIKESIYIATSGRPRPVHLDIPKDVQQKTIIPEYPDKISLRGYKPICEPDSELVKKAAELIVNSKKPFIYAGGGIISSEASNELKTFAELINAPVGMTLMGLGGFPADNELCMDMIGMHGSYYSNYGLDNADLLIVLGARFDDRVTGDPEKFAKDARIIHVDIDGSEHGKVKKPYITIEADARLTLNELINVLDRDNTFYKNRHREWLNELQEVRKTKPFKYKNNGNGAIMPQYILEELSNLLDGDAIVTTDVGQHQMWAAQFVKRKYPRTFLSSSGSGCMGFGLPAAIGAKMALPEKEVVCISGDGSFLMNIQELATLKHESYIPPVKVVILNNKHLGMVAQWEDIFYGSNRGHTELGDVNFADVANAFGIDSRRIEHRNEVVPALKQLLDSKKHFILDCATPYLDQGHVLPMIPAGKSFKEIIYYNF